MRLTEETRKVVRDTVSFAQKHLEEETGIEFKVVAFPINYPEESIDTSPELAEKLLTEVLVVTGLKREDIMRKSRKRELVDARKMAIYLIRYHTNMSLKKIGWFFEGRDHSTIVNAIESHFALAETDKTYIDIYARIMQRINRAGIFKVEEDKITA